MHRPAKDQQTHWLPCRACFPRCMHPPGETKVAMRIGRQQALNLQTPAGVMRAVWRLADAQIWKSCGNEN